MMIGELKLSWKISGRGEVVNLPIASTELEVGESQSSRNIRVMVRCTDEQYRLVGI
jgi:hypothetical protein